MKSKLILASTALALLTVMTNCKKNDKVIEPNTIQQNENGKVELFPNVKVVSNDENNKLVSVTDEKIVFKGESDFLNSIKEGDIIMASINEIAPDGYLRVVQNIEKNEDVYTMHTKNASLENAIKNGSIHVDFPVMFNANDDGSENTKVSGFSGTVSKTIGLNHVLYDYDGNKTGTIYDQVSTNGSLVLSANMSVDMNFSWGSLTYFDAKATFAATNSQTLNIGGTLNIPQKTFKVYNSNSIPSVSFWVGMVPINIKPIVDVYVDFGGQITASAKFGYKGSTSITPEIKYQSRNWSYSHTKTFSLVGYKPVTNVSATFNASLRPRLTFALYGCTCTSAYLQASVYGDLNCTLLPNISKKITGGIKIGAGATLFGKNVSNDSFYNYTFPI